MTFTRENIKRDKVISPANEKKIVRMGRDNIDLGGNYMSDPNTFLNGGQKYYSDNSSLNTTTIQPKLTIGKPNNTYEQEADRVADQVMKMQLSNEEKYSLSTKNDRLKNTHGVCTSCNGERLQTKPFDFPHLSTVQRQTDPSNVKSVTNKQRHEQTKPVFRNEQVSQIQENVFIQRQPDQEISSQAQLNELCYTSDPQPSPSASEPELHPTYEQWLHSFTGMATFRSNDTVPEQTARYRFLVLGTIGQRYGTTSSAETEPVPVEGSYDSGEEFIDHPTNEWVQNCLPSNLRATAYQLPSDCADIAVILRHVWLSAHHRTETYNGWTVGDRAGEANQSRASDLINSVWSGNVANIVQAYSDSSRNPITNFNVLSPMLHPGDILVWEHREIETDSDGNIERTTREGGHTQTISNIVRMNGSIVSIQVIQGNQPIFSDEATAILQLQGAHNTDPESSAGLELRNLPGRRIEASYAISTTNIRHPQTHQEIWGSLDSSTEFTILVAAGPPRAASRPHVSRRRSRSILDWSRAINSASRDTIAGVEESVLQEARSLVEAIEASSVPSTSDMETLGQLLGEKLRDLYSHNVADLIQIRNNFITVIGAIRHDSNNVEAVTPLFDSFEQAFNRSAVPSDTSVESTRLYIENSNIGRYLEPFSENISNLSDELSSARTLSQLQDLVNQAGFDLWQASTALAQDTTDGNVDDRPLYWTRMRMIEDIRLFNNRRIRISARRRQQLIETFENASRGITSVDFSPATGEQKKVLISGFDPFGLDTPNTSEYTNMTILDSNPSGSAVLALDGQQISGTDNLSAYIQGVIFPVRYSDFDQGEIESFFTPFLDGTNPVSMIMTISQGYSSFDIERWAGRRRSVSSFSDNQGALGGGSTISPVEPPGIATGPEFLETQLPHAAMTTVPDTRLNEQGRNPGVGEPGLAVTGTGGGFLSNEIFYRVRLLQTNIGGTMADLPVGHLHVPNEDDFSATEIVNRVKAIIEASLPAI